MSPMEPGFSPARPSIRDALNATIEGCNIVVSELSQRSKVPAPAISRFQNRHRELTTRVLHQILQALSAEEYHYFLESLKGGADLLEDAEPALSDKRLRDDRDFQYAAFRALVSNFVASCDAEQFEDLLCLMADSRRSAKNRAQSADPEDEKAKT
ncbi:MAG: hypothetical protein F6J95_027585 [Leptolyngbya sp. SIO1E4]|nr:hypothetical protein [Leptolyngbya sp. SIO1E4]